MKNTVLLLALIFCIQAFSQRKPKIKGNRDVVEIQEFLPAFTAIELRDDLKIELQQASEEGYAITADDNLIDVLKFEVEDSTLVISSFYKITGKKKLQITVNYNYLSTLTVSAGDIRMQDAVRSDELFVRTSESAKLQLNAEASKIDILMEGNSSGDYTLTADDITMALKDRIDARIFTDSQMNDVKMYGNASAGMEGMTEELNVTLTGNSSLKGRRLQATNAFLTLEESPYADVNVTTNVELTSSGSSITHVYGEGTIKLVSFLDTSQLHREK